MTPGTLFAAEQTTAHRGWMHVLRSRKAAEQGAKSRRPASRALTCAAEPRLPEAGVKP